MFNFAGSPTHTQDVAAQVRRQGDALHPVGRSERAAGERRAERGGAGEGAPGAARDARNRGSCAGRVATAVEE